MVLIPFLIFLSLMMLGAGIGYAILIYYRPFPPGWTYLSVGVGVGLTLIGEITAILMTLSVANLLHDTWWIAFYGFIAFCLTGIPMAIGQEIKRRQQNKVINGKSLREEIE